MQEKTFFKQWIPIISPNFHWVKGVRIRSYSGLYFPAFRLNTRSVIRITRNTATFHAVFYVAISTSLRLIFIQLIDRRHTLIQWFLYDKMFGFNCINKN